MNSLVFNMSNPNKLRNLESMMLDRFINDAIKFHTYIFDYFNGDLSQITALEYFGYNCQNYMKHHDYFFQDKEDVGIYFQYPIYDKTLESEIEYWFNLIN